MLRECLNSLEKSLKKSEAEIIVVSNFETDSMKGEFSIPITFIKAPDGATVPQLRSRGVKTSRGNIIALLEDLCVFDPDWVEEIKTAHQSEFSIIGGTVENGQDKNALDWAVYFYDYGKYMLPNEATVTETLSGLNISYKRDALEEVKEAYRDGFFATFVNEALKKRGHQLYMAPAAIVFDNKKYELRPAIGHAYHLARSFAAQRAAEFGFPKKLGFAAASVILPLLLPLRISLATVKKGRHLTEFFRSFSFLFLLTSIWSFGEFRGYLSGAGKSDAEWR